MMSGLFMAGAVHNMARTNAAQSAGERASRTAAQVRTQNETITSDIEKLFMITESLWTILKEHHGYTDEHLGTMMQDIDLRDGKLDGKVAKQQNPACPQCERILMGKHPVCLYCGTAVVREPFER
jgi:ribosomal protein S27AE